MVDYYKIIGVKSTATTAEIKSAYRRLAREHHPDINPNSEARDFATITRAYRTLIDPHERAQYDQQRQRARRNAAELWNDSVIGSDNPHAQRLRRMAAQRRWDLAVDRWIESERHETRARTQAVFTTVTLFLSTFMVAVFKPRLWESFDDLGRIVILGLFLAGMYHLFSRFRSSFARYTYSKRERSEDAVQPPAPDEKPFTRFKAAAFLIAGYTLSLVVGLLVGSHVHDMLLLSDIPYWFGTSFRLDLFVYPPIAVLLVDLMHTVASKVDV